MAIPDSFIEELKNRADLAEIISRDVELKRRGSIMVGLCPFHSEKTPSFTVYPEKGNYHCFGCNAGGDAITYIRTRENLDYVDAIKILASMCGMQMPLEDGDTKQQYKKREKTFEINKQTARFYHETLMSAAGSKGKKYIDDRQINENIVKRFGLGYAPAEWDALTKHLVQKGFEKEEIYEAGLAKKNSKGGYYDFFRDRVMFPIIDITNRVIAFGGRAIEKDEERKYINSSDTLAFKKGNNLFALNIAKNTQSGRLILAEGYMDVITMHQYGITEAVATLGTAITEEQARLIGKYTKNVVIAYDSDKAGQAATQKAIVCLSKVGISIKVLKIVGGKDPDEFIKNFGADRFKLLLDESENHIEYKLLKMMESYDMDKLEEKVAYIKEATAMLSQLDSSIESEIYAGRLAEMTYINRDSVIEQVRTERKRKTKKSEKDKLKRESDKNFGLKNDINKEKYGNLLITSAEESILCIMFNHQDKLNTIFTNVEADDFETSFNKRIFNRIKQAHDESSPTTLAMFNESFSVKEMGEIVKIFKKNEDCYENIDVEIKGCADSLKRERIKKETKLSDEVTHDAFKKLANK